MVRKAPEEALNSIVSNSLDQVELDGEGGRPSRSKGFFLVDVAQFERICSSGLGVEEAAAYVALAVSTNESNVITTGGINSITAYTGLRRSEAGKAVQRLEERGLLKALEVQRKRARTVPRYVLTEHDPRPQLAAKERDVLDAIAAGRQPEGKDELNAAQRARAKGHVERRSDGWAIVQHVGDVAYIPNTFVRVKEGDSPLARLVNHGEIGPLMLAAELYRHQDLMNEGGIPTRVVRGYYTAQWQTQVGRHRLHRLSHGRRYTNRETGAEEFFDRVYTPSDVRPHVRNGFWENLRALESMHVVEWTVYSANGVPEGNQYAFNRPQRPLGVLRNGRQVLGSPESIPAFATYLLLLHTGGATEFIGASLAQVIAEWQEISPVLVLENQSVAHVEGVATLRMTHRADTDNSRAWRRQTLDECRRALFFVEQVARENIPQAVDLITVLQDQEDLKNAISK